MSDRCPRTRRAGGSILLTVAMAIIVVGAIAFLVSREATLQLHLGAASSDEEAAIQIAQAGIAHGLWYTENVGCGPQAGLSAQPLGEHEYDLAFNALPGGKLEIVSTGRLANGVQRELQAEGRPLAGDPAGLILAPSADVYVHTDDHNDGPKLDLHVKRDASTGKVENSLLRFDLPPMKRWAVVAAGLRLSLFTWNKEADPFPLSGPVSLSAHTVTRGWLEGAGENPCPCSGATLSSYDGNMANLWTTPAGDFLPQPLDTQTLGWPGDYTWDVSPAVRDWAAGNLPNFGLAVTGVASSPDQAKFRSREYGVANERPRLMVVLDCPCGSVCRTTYRDEFDRRTCTMGSGDWSGSNGALSADWSLTPWQRDTGDPTDDSCSGDIRLEWDDWGDYKVVFEGDGVTLERGADLSTHNQARLSFEYQRDNIDGLRFVDVDVSDDGGSSWQPLIRILAGDDATPQRIEFDISPYMSADTRIRFTGRNLFSGARFYLDDVQIDESPLLGWDLPVTVVPVEADSFVRQDDASQNFGGDDNIILRDTSSADRRGVFRFDLTAFPPGTALQSAVLRMWVNRNNSNAGGANLIARAISEAWQEGEVSWNERTATSNWSTPGVSVQPITVGQTHLPEGQKDLWVEIDITPLAQAWVDGVIPNQGVRLETDQDRDLKFTSVEKDPGLAAHLRITAH